MTIKNSSNFNIKIILFIVITTTLFLFSGCKEDADKKQINIIKNSDSLKTDSASVTKEIIPEYLEGKILPGQGFTTSLLAVKGVKMKHALKIVNALRFNIDFGNLRAGKKFKLKLTDDSSRVKEFIYKPNIVTCHKLKLDSATDKLIYKEEVLQTEKRYRLLDGSIKTTLNQALIDEDVPSDLRQISNGVLECCVSFRTEARKNDTFRILLEEKYYNNEKLPGGRVLYASYNGKRAGFHEAYKFEDNDKKSAYTAHYSPKGKALLHSSLRLPVDRVHITSPYGYRIHPVTGRRAFHSGVDYRGKVGDPVYAVAKGRVVSVTQDRLGGKKIVLKHADGTKTYYLHLNKFLVKPGQMVKPRQRIANIGRTGRVTGPHLHFGVKSARGKWVNPLKKRMIATPQLKGDRLKRFQSQIKDIEEVIANLTAPSKNLIAETDTLSIQIKPSESM